MAEKERKNVLEVRNHTDHVVSFLIRLLKRKKNVAFRPQSSSYSVHWLYSFCLSFPLNVCCKGWRHSMPLSCQDLNSKRKFLPRYKKLYLKSEFNFNISHISQQGYFTDTQSERLYKYIFFLSFF